MAYEGGEKKEVGKRDWERIEGWEKREWDGTGGRGGEAPPSGEDMDVGKKYIILRWVVGGKEESSDAGGAEEKKYGVEIRRKVLEVERSQAIPWLLLSGDLLRKALHSESS